ncbi:MAG: cyclic dehypoxanthinyl futalosine synthase [Armatimonadota bacterium]|nr:cyclic dehypoxanthinyl futalosine synthase [Armatimonadota bacterium]
MSAQVSEILRKATNGTRISSEEALTLFAEAALPELAWAAEQICQSKHPENVRTYVIDRNINYTNVCISGCAFCAFFRPPGHPEGYVLSIDEILRKVSEAVNLGATQILMQGGLHPDLDVAYFESLFREIKKQFSVHLHSLSAPEIVHIARISGLSVRETLKRLQAAGLDSLPGGGAEILVDSVRRRLSPRKCRVDEWVQVMRIASELNMKGTATMVFGMGESFADRVAHLTAVRDLQDETGVFTAFIPWTYQPGNTTLGGDSVGGHDYLRTLAVSRIYLDNIHNIQASWVTQGAQVAELALRFGANDAGSTMIEENVVAATGVSYKMDERGLVDLIHRAGYRAAQRTTLYEIVKLHEA